MVCSSSHYRRESTRNTPWHYHMSYCEASHVISPWLESAADV
jgi:hypothetical protein